MQRQRNGSYREHVTLKTIASAEVGRASAEPVLRTQGRNLPERRASPAILRIVECLYYGVRVKTVQTKQPSHPSGSFPERPVLVAGPNPLDPWSISARLELASSSMSLRSTAVNVYRRTRTLAGLYMCSGGASASPRCRSTPVAPTRWAGLKPRHYGWISAARRHDGWIRAARPDGRRAGARPARPRERSSSPCVTRICSGGASAPPLVPEHAVAPTRWAGLKPRHYGWISAARRHDGWIRAARPDGRRAGARPARPRERSSSPCVTRICSGGAGSPATTAGYSAARLGPLSRESREIAQSRDARAESNRRRRAS